MAKQKYWNGSQWVSVAPSQQEFDQLYNTAVKKSGAEMTGDLGFDVGTLGLILKDRNTGIDYRLTVVDAKLFLEEV